MVGPAVAFTGTGARLGGHAHDFIGAHIYKHNQPIVSWNWEDKLQELRTAYASPQPIYMTEMGQNTRIGGIGSSERAQMKMTTQLVATHFRFRSEFDEDWIRKAYLHQLMDESSDPVDENGSWGLVRADGLPKPAFTALRRMIALLREGAWDPGTGRWNVPAFEPSPLSYDLPNPDIGGGRRIERRLLQKSDGDWYLLLWLDADIWDEDRGRDLETERTETLRLPGRFDVVQHRFDEEGNLPATTIGTDVEAVRVTIPDSVTVLRIRLRAR